MDDLPRQEVGPEVGAGAALLVEEPAHPAESSAGLLAEVEPLRQLLEGIDALLYLTEGGTREEPGRILYVSRAYERIWGRPLETLHANPRSWTEALHPGDRARILAAVPGLDGSGFDEEYRIVRPDGEIRWLHQRVFPIYNDAGRIYRTAGIIQDITDRKLAEADLDFVLAHVRCLLLHAEVLAPQRAREPFRWTFKVFDAAAAQRFFPLDVQEGESYIDAFYRLKPPEDRALVDRNARQAFETGQEGYSQEFRCLRLDGALRWLREEAHIEPLGPGRWRVAALYTDVTERKRLMEQLAEADRRKDEFLSMLAHELRNPLAPIRNAAELLRSAGNDATAIRRHSEVIERQTRLLTRLVDDLLDVSRITQGQVDLRRQPVLLSAVIEQALEVARPLIEGRHHEVSLHLPEEPVPVAADAARVCQILANLLNNAAKYTDPGGQISVTLEIANPPIADCGLRIADLGTAEGEPAPAGHGTGVASQSAIRNPQSAIVRVRDNGIGLAPEVLPVIFDLYTREERGLTRSQGGLGIGLSLARSLAEMHGGTVEAASDGPGCGSEFMLRLPLLQGAEVPTRKPGRDGAATASAASAPRPLRVLLVEDNADAAETLCELLPAWGHECFAVRTGAEAFTAVDSFDPDVVLLDIGLPDLDGYEVARGIRACTEGWACDAATPADALSSSPSPTPNAQRPTPTLIALTGYGRDQDRTRAREAGCDEHLTKPVEPEVLRRLLDRLAQTA